MKGSSAGFGEGITLRLEGTSFKRVLALGGSPRPTTSEAPSAPRSPRRGRAGSATTNYPVHLTLSPAPDRLSYYPVPFRYALSAFAPQPGAPAGALSSEALAVGDHGEVARYHQGQGWAPETLFGAGERREVPDLRAVAWPTPNRAYAVGIPERAEGRLNQMWLWRGETGRWEPDPARPLNFNGNLLGIAFDPNDPSRGYAVGEQGVLLRFGKTWAQEDESAIPVEARGASFTAVAFSGSEALVAFRKNHPLDGGEPQHYTGGLLVNDGSGWRIDGQAGEALAGAIPWTVAGLPDGGAALAATVGGLPGTASIAERQSGGGPWQTTAPYPGQAPGSLALFREAGAVRVVGSGGLPNTLQIEDQRELPLGQPPEPSVRTRSSADTWCARRATAGAMRNTYATRPKTRWANTGPTTWSTSRTPPRPS